MSGMQVHKRNHPPFKVAVTGLGVISSAGIGVEENWKTLCAGKSTARYDPALDGLEVNFSCTIPHFDADALLGKSVTWRIDRFIQLALVAAREAVASSGINFKDIDTHRVGIVVGNSLAGCHMFDREAEKVFDNDAKSVSAAFIPGSMPNMVSGQIAIEYGIKGPAFTVGAACASGGVAIGMAREMIRSRICDVVLVGSTESALTPLIISSFNKMGALSKNKQNPETACRPFDVDRDGFVASEGAGFMVLERTEHAAARHAEIQGYIAGFGTATDAYHVTKPHPEGLGLTSAIRAALQDAQLPEDAISHVNAHGTSTKINDRLESKVLYDIFGDGTIVTSTKGVTGHALAAAGAMEAIYALLAVKYNTVPPTANLTEIDPDTKIVIAKGNPMKCSINAALSTSLGFGGHNSALIVTRD